LPVRRFRTHDVSGFGERRAGLHGRADKLRQTRAFKQGKSLSNDAAVTCPAKVLIPGRARKPDDRRTDHDVTCALCP
jgi:hypothetical protein